MNADMQYIVRTTNWYGRLARKCTLYDFSISYGFTKSYYFHEMGLLVFLIHLCRSFLYWNIVQAVQKLIVGFIEAIMGNWPFLSQLFIKVWQYVSECDKLNLKSECDKSDLKFECDKLNLKSECDKLDLKSECDKLNLKSECDKLDLKSVRQADFSVSFKCD